MGTTVTKEQATEALVEERRVEMQAKVDQQDETERLENDRLEALSGVKSRAVALIEERNKLLPAFVEALAQVGQSATKLRELRDEYMHLTASARKLEGTTNTQWPRQFGVDPQERRLLREALQILGSVGGYV